MIDVEREEKKSESEPILENFTSLDLELNQPSGKIIQIGAAIGNLKTGEIHKTFSAYIKN